MQVLSHPRLSRTLQVLQSNPAAKIFLVNVATVAAPRVYIDYHRNKDAGNESLFYEGFSLFSNYIAPGLLALGTASLLKKFNNPLHINTTQWISNEAVDAFSHHYKAALGKLDNRLVDPKARKEAFFHQVLSHLEAKRSLDGKLTHLGPQHIQELAHDVTALPLKEKASQSLIHKLTARLESADQISLLAAPNGKAMAIQPKDFLTQLSKMGHEFQKVHTADQIHHLVSKVHFSNNAKAAFSLSIVAGLGFFAQFINKWITKERTGKTGFVGTENLIAMEDDEPEASNQLPAMTVRPAPSQADDKTIGAKLVGQVHVPGHATKQNEAQANNPETMQQQALGKTHSFHPVSKTTADQTKNQNDKKNQQQPTFGGFASNQFLPNVDQLKYIIYPAGIIGKMLASRSIDELRETAIKAGFAYFNLLFIPNLVENVVAYAAGKHHIFSRKPDLKPLTSESGLWEKTKYYFKSVNQAHIRSYEDINLYAKQYAQKLSAMKGEALEKELKTLIPKPEMLLSRLNTIQNPLEREQHLSDAILKRLSWVKNAAVLSGILYSALTLGIGLNLLNIYITNRRYTRNGADDEGNPLFGLASHNPFAKHTS